MKRMGMPACVPLFLVLALAASPSIALPRTPPAEPGPRALLDEPSDDGDEKDKKEAEDEGSGEEEEPKEEGESKAEKKKGGITKEEADEANALWEVSVSELDQKSPRFIYKGKETPAFVMVRPPAAKPSKSGKAVQIDGSRWGFVDLAQRRKRLISAFEKYIAIHERLNLDESLSQQEREEARKKVNGARAGKSGTLLHLDETRAKVELSGNEKAWLEVVVKDRPAGLQEKDIREQLKTSLEKEQFKILSERPEKWRGNKIPGYTFIAEGEMKDPKTGAPEPTWLRKTYFIVPRQKGLMAIVRFDCQAPKSVYGEQIEKEFEAFIRGTQFN